MQASFGGREAAACGTLRSNPCPPLMKNIVSSGNIVEHYANFTTLDFKAFEGGTGEVMIKDKYKFVPCFKKQGMKQIPYQD